MSKKAINRLILSFVTSSGIELIGLLSAFKYFSCFSSNKTGQSSWKKLFEILRWISCWSVLKFAGRADNLFLVGYIFETKNHSIKRVQCISSEIFWKGVFPWIFFDFLGFFVGRFAKFQRNNPFHF